MRTSFKQWLKEHETHKKIGWKQSVSDGTREIDKEDLSDDYPGHLSNMGKVYPFKVLNKGKKKKKK